MKTHKSYSPSSIRVLSGSKALRVFIAWNLVFGQMVFAAPQGAQVQNGQASIQQDGATTHITASNNAVINYTGFDIYSHETVQFHQPSASSRVLNRVNSPDPTTIAGKLQSNGIVYIVNPAGIYFANGALVDVGGIYAAAAQISNSDFLSNIDRFTSASGSVMNYGVIDSGFTHLIGKHVSNHGTILADQGVMTMVAGEDVLLTKFDDHVMVKITGAAADVAQADQAGVENHGTIQAKGGKVTLGAGDMFSLALGNGSVVKADAITVEGGEGSTAQVAGVLDASNTAEGATGGSVHVLADKVVVDGASIDASGDAGGGEVLIGVNGDRSRIASQTQVTNSQITAQALTTGDGGFVEISGHALGYSGSSVNLLAADGQTGMFLLDPLVTIIGDTDSPLPTDEPFLIAAATLVSDLNTANVTVMADTSITVNSLVDASANANSNDLTLTAPTLDINAGIILNSGNLTLNGGTGGVTIDGALGTVANPLSSLIVEGDTIAINAAITLNNGNNVFLRQATVGREIDLGGALGGTRLLLTNADLNQIAGGANITIGDNQSGAITVSDDITLAQAAVQSLRLDTTGGITGSGVIAAELLDLRASDNITLNTNVNNLQARERAGNNANPIDITIVNDGTVTIPGGIANGAIQSQGGDVSITSSTGDIALNSDAIRAGAGNVSLTANTGSITANSDTITTEILIAAGTTNTDPDNPMGTVSLSTQSTGANSIDIQNATALTVTNTGAGDINVREAGTHSIANTTVTVNSGAAGRVLLDYEGSFTKREVDAGNTSADRGVDITGLTLTNVQLDHDFTFFGSGGDIEVQNIDIGAFDAGGSPGATLRIELSGNNAIRLNDRVDDAGNPDDAADWGILAPNGTVILNAVDGSIVSVDVNAPGPGGNGRHGNFEIFTGSVTEGVSSVQLAARSVGTVSNLVDLFLVADQISITDTGAGDIFVRELEIAAIAPTDLSIDIGGANFGRVLIEREDREQTPPVLTPLIDITNLALANAQLGGTNLTLRGDGSITQPGGIISTTGALAIEARGGSNSITLGQANAIDGAVTLKAGGNATLVNSTASAMTLLTVDDGNGDPTFDVGGDLTVTNNGTGGIAVETVGGQEAPLQVGGTATLTSNGNNSTTLNINADIASGDTVTVTNSGALNVNANITATNTVAITSGTSGNGSLNFGSNVTLSSSVITLSGGNGSGSTAEVFAVANAPEFRSANGNSNPTSFTIEQDDTIDNAFNVPNAAQFFGDSVEGVQYGLTALAGNLNVASVTKVEGTDLTLDASGDVIISDVLTLKSLTSNAATTRFSGTSGVATSGVSTPGAAGQSYTGNVELASGANVTLTDTNAGSTGLAFTGTVTGAGDLTLDVQNAGATTTFMDAVNIGIQGDAPGVALTIHSLGTTVFEDTLTLDGSLRLTDGNGGGAVGGLTFQGSVAMSNADATLLYGDVSFAANDTVNGITFTTDGRVELGNLGLTIAPQVTVTNGPLVMASSQVAGADFTLAINADVDGGSQALSFTGSSLLIDTGSTISTNSTVALSPQSGEAIFFVASGDKDTTQFTLTDAELDRISAAMGLTIGSTNAGAINFNAPISLTRIGGVGVDELALITGGGVPSTGGQLTVAALALSAGQAIGAADAPFFVEVNRFAASTTAGGIFLEHSGTLTIDTVATESGLSTSDNSDIQVIVDNSLVLNAPVNAGNGQVSLVANGGTITEGPDATSPSVTAGSLVMRSNGSIASGGNPLDTQINTLAADVSAGSVNVNNTGNLTIGSLGYTVVGDGPFIVTVTGIDTGDGGHVGIETSGTLAVNEEVRGTSVTAVADGTITLNNVVRSDFGLVGGPVELVSSNGSIVDDSLATGPFVDADTLLLDAEGDIGSSGNPLNTEANSLAAQSATGGVFINNTSELTIASLGAVSGINANGNVFVRGNGLIVNQAVQADGTLELNSGAGAMDVNAPLTATDEATLLAGEGMTLSALITAGGSGITQLNAGDSVVFDATGSLNKSGSGSVLVNAIGSTSGTGDIDMADGSSIDAGDGRVTLSANQDIRLSLIQTTNADTGGMAAVTLRSTNGGIVSSRAQPNRNVEAPNGTLNIELANSVGVLWGDVSTIKLTKVTGDATFMYQNMAAISGGTLNIAQSEVTGNLSINAFDGTNIDDAGTLTVGGMIDLATFNNGGANITLDEAGSTFGSVRARALTQPAGNLADKTVTVTVNGPLTLAEVLTAGDAVLTGSTVNVAGDVRADNTLVVTSDDLNISAGGQLVRGGPTGAGILELRTMTADLSIALGNGASGAYSLTSAEIGRISGFNTVELGNPGDAHAIELGSAAMQAPLMVQTADSVTLRGQFHADGGITINSDLAVGLNAFGVLSTNGNDITINGTVDSEDPTQTSLPAGSLILDTLAGGSTGKATITGDVGGTHALEFVDIIAEQIEVASVTTLGGQFYFADADPVAMDPITLRGSSYSSTAFGDLFFDGNVVQDTTAAYTTTDGNIVFTGMIEATGGVAITARRSPIEGSGGGVSVHDINITGGGDLLLQSTARQSGLTPLGLIEINSSLTTDGGDISLNPNTATMRGVVPDVATIKATGNLNINTGGGEFIMGVREKLTANGDINIVTGNGDATISDLSSTGNIAFTLGGGVLKFNLREIGSVRLANSTVQGSDQGTDVVAAGTIEVISASAIDVAFRAPGAANLNPVFASGTLGGIKPLPVGTTVNLPIGTANPSSLDIGVQGVFDLTVGALTGVLDQVFPFVFVPQSDEIDPVTDSLSLEQSEKDLLREIGVPATDEELQELLEALFSNRLFNDITASDVEGEHEVTVNRMLTSAVHGALKSYRTLYTATEVDEEGNVVRTSKADRIREVLTQAWIDYRTTGDEMGPISFYDYLASSPESEEALTYVKQLRAMFNQLRIMGLTDRELAYTKYVLVERGEIMPHGMSRTEFDQLILGEVPHEISAVPATGKDGGDGSDIDLFDQELKLEPAKPVEPEFPAEMGAAPAGDDGVAVGEPLAVRAQ